MNRRKQTSAVSIRSGSVALLACLLLPLGAIAQVNNPAYRNYLLVGQFGEICTMCEAIVYCDADINATPRDEIPDSGSFTVYHLQTRTFWSQIATIWEWFVTNFSSESLARSGHSRPVHIFHVEAGRWTPPEFLDAHLSLEPAFITIGDIKIDRIEGRWLEAADSHLIGFCQRLPLWTSLEQIAEQLPTAIEEEPIG